MTQKTISNVIYFLLLILCILALIYLVTFNRTSSEVQVTILPTAVQQDARQQNVSQTDGVINLNTADQPQLETLPGIGPELAARIIAYREDIGLYVSVEQIKDVPGIGQKRYEDIQHLITVGGAP